MVRDRNRAKTSSAIEINQFRNCELSVTKGRVHVKICKHHMNDYAYRIEHNCQEMVRNILGIYERLLIFKYLGLFLLIEMHGCFNNQQSILPIQKIMNNDILVLKD